MAELSEEQMYEYETSEMIKNSNQFNTNKEDLVKAAKEVLILLGALETNNDNDNLVTQLLNERRIILKKIQSIDKNAVDKTELLNKNREELKKIIDDKKSQNKFDKDFNSFIRGVITFQKELNIFMGNPQSIYIVYQDSNEEKIGTPKVAEINLLEGTGIEDFVKMRISSSKNNYQIGGSFTNITKAHQEKLRASIVKTDKDVELLNMTYRNIMERTEIFKDLMKDRKNKGKGYMQSSFYLLWKTRRFWDGILVQSLGSVNEAYVNFYINGFTPENIGKEFCIKHYAEEGILKVDKNPGLYEGDINGNIQVKSGGASFLGLDQVRTAANIVLEKCNLSNSEIMAALLGHQESIRDQTLINVEMREHLKNLNQTLKKKEQKKLEQAILKQFKNRLKTKI